MRYESGTRAEVIATAIGMAIQYERDFIDAFSPLDIEESTLDAIEAANARIRDFERLLNSSLCR